MNQQDFQQLLQRYLQGKCTVEEINQIHQWYVELGHHSQATLPAEEKEALENKLWRTLDKETEQEVIRLSPQLDKRPRKWLQPVYYSGIAASVLMIVSLVWYVWQNSINRTSKEPLSFFEETTTIHHLNTTAHVQKITLTDKSEVFLNPGSSVRYPSVFNAKREVQLEGNAFFKIARNPQKPFYVYSGKVVTQVLGTSFWVRSGPKDKFIQVAVKTGKVSVYERVDVANHSNAQTLQQVTQGVILKPNQKATYFIEGKNWETGLVEEPVVVETDHQVNHFVYDDTPLQEVIRTLEKGFGIEIMIGSQKLKGCTFTGNLSDLSLYEKLNLICKSLKASYEIRGTHIVIEGEGCE